MEEYCARVEGLGTHKSSEKLTGLVTLTFSKILYPLISVTKRRILDEKNTEIPMYSIVRNTPGTTQFTGLVT